MEETVFVISVAEDHCGVIEFFVSLATQGYIGKTKHNKKRKIVIVQDNNYL